MGSILPCFETVRNREAYHENARRRCGRFSDFNRTNRIYSGDRKNCARHNFLYTNERTQSIFLVHRRPWRCRLWGGPLTVAGPPGSIS